MWSPLLTWIDCGLTDQQPVEQARIRTQHMVVALSVSLASPQGLFFVISGSYVPGVLLLFFAGVTPLWLILTRRGRPELGGTLISVTFMLAIGMVLLTRGGVQTPSAIYLLLPPVLGTMMVGRRLGGGMGVMTAVYLFSVWAAQTMGLELEGVLSPELEWMLTGIDYAGVAMSITMILWVEQGVWQSLVHRMDETNRALVQEVAERQQAENRALAAAKARTTFLATMSHEIRTPLNGVLGLTEVLLDEDLSAEQRRLADTIRSSGNLLRTLLSDVLDFSKIDSGSVELERIPLDLYALCDSTLALWRPIASERGLRLRVRREAESNRWVLGDEVRLKQILGNLVSNAIKFTNKGWIEISMFSEGEVWHIAVEDTGVGIEPGALEKIFEPFQQADATTTRCHGGTGLGLAICHRLARSMGGSLSVASEPGAGSTFTLKLSLPATEPACEESAPEDALSSLEGLRVLVAEDNTVNQMVIRRLLERRGIEVWMAADGEQAIQAWRDEQPELILMDCQMPVCDGYEATRRLRDAGAEVPIVAFTANTMPGDRARCLQAGMDDHIGKPVLSGELYRVLRHWTSRPRSYV